MNAVTVLLLLSGITGFSEDLKGSMPVFFFRNPGQTNPQTYFIAETPTLRAGFRKDSVMFEVNHKEAPVRFLGADPRVVIEAVDEMPGKANFLLGQDTAAWRTDVSLYRKIIYRGLYRGINLSYTGTLARVKSEYLVAAGADPRQIRLAYPGGRVAIESNGDLSVHFSGAQLRENAPDIYQESARGRVRIQGRFRILDEHTAGFEIARYDISKPLIIDPVVTYSSYLGGSGMGAVTGVTADSSGNLYVTGWTEAFNFPLAGAVQAMNRGGVDAFIAKLNPAGSTVLYATYIGGSGEDRGAAIAVDSQGQAYVAGFTQSVNFPVASPAHAGLAGGRNAFALKLSALGSMLIYSTYLGGSAWDQGTAIAVDASGNAYVAGDTQSANFPVVKPVQASFGGMQDAFVAKLNPTGGILFSTFLGGAGTEHAGGIAVDSAGNMYLAGGTFSNNFPVAGAIQSTNGGGQDAFITKMNSSGSALIYSTYFGGLGGGGATPEQANAVAVDAGGNAYVTGVTSSSNFPVTAGALRTSYNGSVDSFVTKLSTSGSLVYSTFLGGTSWNWAAGVAVDQSGNAYVAGSTNSADFPMVNANSSSLLGGYDAFLSEVNPAGSALVYSTYYGGTGSDAANGLALDPLGNIYLGGQTSSSDFPRQGAIQPVYSGSATGWVLRLGTATAPSQSPELIWMSDASSQAVSWSESGAGGNVETGYSWLSQAGVPGWTLAATGDFNGDGIPDLIWQNDTTRQAVIWYMGGTNGTQEQSWAWLNNSNPVPGWRIVAAADFNRDGVPDVVWLNDTTRQAVIWYMGGVSGSIEQSWSWVSSAGVFGWTIRAAGDFNHDGIPDIVWEQDNTRQALIWYMSGADGSQHSTYDWISQTGVPGWTVAGVGDFNGDGSLDVVWLNDTTQQAVVWYMSGADGTTYLSYNWLSQTGVYGWKLLVRH